MKKSTRRLLRFGLPLALFGGCLLFSYHMNALPGLLEPGTNSHHNDDGVQLSEMYVNDAAHKHTKQDSAANRTHEVGNKSKLLNRRNQTALLGDTDVCRGVEPWFKKRSSWKQIQLIFYGKPIMQVVKRLCVQRHWKMMIMLNESDPSSLYELQKRVNEEGTFTIMFTSSRLYHLAIVQRLANSTRALVSSIRYAFKTTGPKKEQLNVFRNHFLSYGCMLEEVGIMPRSFLLDDSYDCIQFFKYAHLNPTSWWVLKKSHGYGGEGISIHQNSSKLYTKFGLCKGNREYVVQEYIYNLLLVEKRKFDIRGLVLIAGTNPYFLFYHEGYLRVSVSDFSYNSNRNVHITNSHLQVMSRDFDPEKHFWSFERFQSFLDAHHPENNHFVENKLIPFIKNTSLFLLQSSLNVFRRMPSSYLLLGLDFMVTADYRVWFIEANNYPLWPKGSPFINNLMDKMGNNMYDLLFELRETPASFVHMRPGDHYKSWQLVWSEVDYKCSADKDKQEYNPCKLFT